MKKIFSISPLLLIIISLAGASLLAPKTVKADCGGSAPSAPVKVSATSGPKHGQITLYWDEAANANRYAVAYGTVTGRYIYGADNIGGEKSRSYTVSALQAGTKYYFKLAAARDCASSPFSTEVNAVAAGGVQVASERVGAPTTQVTTPVSTVKPVTTGPKVGKLGISASSGPKEGEVTLSWSDTENADNYHLVYGTKAGKYQFGALNIGKTSYTVKKLIPGQTYYFALVPVKGQALYTTDAVSAVAKMNVEVVETTKDLLSQSKIVISPEPKKSEPKAEVTPSLSVTGEQSTPSSSPEASTTSVPTQAAGQ